MIDFLAAHWASVLIALGAVAGIIFLFVRKQWGVLEKMLFAAVTWAERTYGGGTGQLKLAAVVERVYPHIPAILRCFITADGLTRLIEEALAAAKARWDKNPALVAGAIDMVKYQMERNSPEQ